MDECTDSFWLKSSMIYSSVKIIPDYLAVQLLISSAVLLLGMLCNNSLRKTVLNSMRFFMFKYMEYKPWIYECNKIISMHSYTKWTFFSKYWLYCNGHIHFKLEYERAFNRNILIWWFLRCIVCVCVLKEFWNYVVTVFHF